MSELNAIFFRDFKNAYIPEIMEELYKKRVYFKYLEQDGNNEKVIIDGGANIGLFTHYAYPFASKIYSVEPSKDHFETLNKMLEFNKMTDKVVPVNVAIDIEAGNKTFYKGSNTTMYSLEESLKVLSTDKEEVEAITIEDLFNEYKIEKVDFLKLDIEGSEGKVIQGKAFENIAHKINSLVFEWHTWSEINPRLIVSTLNDYGFEIEPISAEASLFGGKRK